MKREAQPLLSEEGQQVLNQYTCALQQVEDLSAVTIRNYLSDLRQFIAWCERFWREMQEDRFFTPQAVAPPLPESLSNNLLAQTCEHQSGDYELETLLRLGDKDADHPARSNHYRQVCSQRSSHSQALE